MNTATKTTFKKRQIRQPKQKWQMNTGTKASQKHELYTNTVNKYKNTIKYTQQLQHHNKPYASKHGTCD